MYNYKVTVKSDTGKFIVKTSAMDEQQVRKAVCQTYGIPDSAIIKVIESAIAYKVVKMGKASKRKQILHYNLTEQEAKQIVQSFPHSDRSMVYYINQNKW